MVVPRVRLECMKNANTECQNEVTVSLTITDFEEHPSEITRILEISPSRVWCKGELIDARTSIRYKQNGWKLFSSLSKNQTFREHIDNLLEILIPLSNRFRNLPLICQIELTCCFYIYHEMPEIFLDGLTLKRLSKLDAGIDIDLYYFGPPRFPQLLHRYQEAFMCHHREEDSAMKIPISWSIDQFGRIMGPRLRDGYLTGVWYSEGQRLKLQIQNLANERIEIEFLEIIEMNITQLCNGAIISDVSLWKVNSTPVAWNVPDSAWNILFSERYGLAGAQEKARKLAREHPYFWLAQVECSYGGAMAAICNRVEIFSSRPLDVQACRLD